MRHILLVAAAAAVLGLGNVAGADVLTFQEGDGGLYSATDATWIEERAPTTNHDGNGTLGFELEYRASPNHLIFRSLVGFFDIMGGNPGQIPLGSTVNSATLTGYVRDNTGASQQNTVHQMLTAWDETTATWGSFGNSGLTAPLGPAVNPGGGQPGVDYDATPLDSITMPAGDNTSPVAATFDVTAAVQAWADGQPNRGFLIMTPGSNHGDWIDDEDPRTQFRPLLTVDFTAPQTAVPEPSAFVLAALGLLGALLVGRRQPKRAV